MADFPSNAVALPGGSPYAAPILLDGWTTNVGVLSNGAATASTAWPANNKAYFYPVSLGVFVTVYNFYFWVGATSSGNIDVGVYDSEKNLLVAAGSTAMSATISTIQVVPCTDTVLSPGDYLIGGVCSTTVGTCLRSTNTMADELFMPTQAVYEQATALPLPNPCVPVLTTDASPVIWAFGAICRSVF